MDGPVAEQSIVIDNGSLNMKAGYSGEDLPRNTFRCIVGHDNRPHHDEWFVSNHCDGKEEYLEMIRPISRVSSSLQSFRSAVAICHVIKTCVWFPQL